MAADTLAHVRVHDALDELATGALRRIASTHGLSIDEAAPRADLLQRLSSRLSDPRFVRELLESLPPEEHAALVAARANGGEIRGFLLDRDHPGAAGSLVDRGLLFRTFAAAGPRRGEVFAVPEELFALLPVPPDAVPPPTESDPPTERRWSDPAFSLFALVSSVQRHGSDLEAEVRGWSEEPGGWDWSARWRFFRHLAQGAGLLASESAPHALPGSEPGPHALPRLLDDPRRLADRLWRTYLDDHAWSELHEVGIEQAHELGDAALVRSVVIEAVSRLPEGAWTRLDAFSDWLEHTQPDLVREQLDARGRLLVEPLGWDRLELPLLRLVLLGPMYWLGRVWSSPDGRLFALRPVASAGRSAHSASAASQPASSSPQSLVAEAAQPAQDSVRKQSRGGALLSPSGATHAPGDATQPASGAGKPLAAPPASSNSPQSLVAEAAQPPQGSVRTQSRGGAAEPCSWAAEDTAELLVPATASLGLVLQAERYLVLEERGRISRYRLIQQHVAAALGSGGSIDDCRTLLRKLTQDVLPDHIEARLSSWQERFGAVSLRPTVVLESQTADELDAALAEPTVFPFVRHRLGATVAEVAAADVLELATALRESGHLPRVDAALRLGGEPRHSYPGLVDEQVLEFLLVSLLAFEKARPERLAELEGAPSLIERLQRLFAPERLRELRSTAERLAGDLLHAPATSTGASKAKPRRRPAQKRRVTLKLDRTSVI